jgi:hypothetical protein
MEAIGFRMYDILERPRYLLQAVSKFFSVVSYMDAVVLSLLAVSQVALE